MSGWPMVVVMILDLGPAEAIACAHAIEGYHTKIIAHYAERGVPACMKAATREHIEVQEATHAKMLEALRAEGYVMRNDDLIPADIDAIMARPWIPPTPAELSGEQ